MIVNGRCLCSSLLLELEWNFVSGNCLDGIYNAFRWIDWVTISLINSKFNGAII